MYKQPGERSAPVGDNRFLTPAGSSARPGSQHSSQKRQDFSDDDTDSVNAFGLNALALEDRCGKNVKRSTKGKARVP